MNENAQAERWLRLLFSVAAVQAFFWFVINPNLFGRPDMASVEQYQTSNHRVASVDQLTESPIPEQAFDGIDQLPWSDCCAPGYRVLRYDVLLDDIPQDGLAILYDLGADNGEIWVNGLPVVAKGNMSLPDISYDANIRAIERLPAGVLRIGENTIEYRLVRDSVPWFDAYPPLIGPFGEVQQALSWRAFVIGDLSKFYMWGGFLLSAFAFVLLIQSRSKALTGSMFVLLALWTLRSHYFFWTDPPFTGGQRIAYYFALTGLLPLAWLCFVDQWTQKPFRWLWQTALAFGSGWIAFCLFSFVGGVSEIDYAQADRLLAVVGSIIMGLTAARLLWHVWRVPEHRFWEAALLLLLATLIVLELVFQQTHYMVGTQPLLLLALLIAFFARSVRLFRSEQEIRDTLAGQLAESKAKLRTFYEREAEAERQRTLMDERKRIMRDMHDGLGSRLFGIAAQLRQRGDDDSAEAAEGVLEVIDELRLIVDSLDTAGDDLGIALGAFRARLEPKLEAAGVSLAWQIDDRAADAVLSSGEILELFRLLQEAFTNVMRHADANELTFKLYCEDDTLMMSVCDNGSGFNPQQRGGMGLRNMETRVQRLNGSLLLTSGSAGTELVVNLPRRLVVNC